MIKNLDFANEYRVNTKTLVPKHTGYERSQNSNGVNSELLKIDDLEKQINSLKQKEMIK